MYTKNKINMNERLQTNKYIHRQQESKFKSVKIASLLSVFGIDAICLILPNILKFTFFFQCVTLAFQFLQLNIL